MDQLYPDEGLIYMLEKIADAEGSGLYWRLYENNVTPTLATTVADLTLSSTSWGRIQVDVSSFTLEQVTSHVGTIQAPNITFTNSTGSSKTVYGYALLNPAEDMLIGVARFDDAPRVIPNGSTTSVTPIIGDKSDLSS